MTDLDEAAREIIEREREAWQTADAVPVDGASRAWAAGPARHAALVRARVARVAASALVVGAAVFGAVQWLDHRSSDQTVEGTDVQGLPTASWPLNAPLVSPAAAPPSTSVTDDPPGPAAPGPAAETAVAARVPGQPSAPPPRDRRSEAASQPAEAPLLMPPSAPEVAPSAPEEDALNAEFRLLREARVAIRDGRFDAALTICAQHASSFPSGVLTPERRAIERRARCLAANRDGQPLTDDCR